MSDVCYIYFQHNKSPRVFLHAFHCQYINNTYRRLRHQIYLCYQIANKVIQVVKILFLNKPIKTKTLIIQFKNESINYETSIIILFFYNGIKNREEVIVLTLLPPVLSYYHYGSIPRGIVNQRMFRFPDNVHKNNANN